VGYALLREWRTSAVRGSTIVAVGAAVLFAAGCSTGDSSGRQSLQDQSNVYAVMVCESAQSLADLHFARGRIPHAARDNPTTQDDAQYAAMTTQITRAAAALDQAAVKVSDPDLQNSARTIAAEDMQSGSSPVLPNWFNALGELPKKCAQFGHPVQGIDALDMAM
jgi:hypothetical protein